MLELAYDEPLGHYLDAIGPGQHLVRRRGGQLVSHVMWVQRWVQVGEGPLLRTAYVELVGTHPDFRAQGLARELMTELIERVQGFELAALAPEATRLYEHLGWVPWRGPLFARRGEELVPADSDEVVLIHPLPRTPVLDLDAPLSVEWRSGELF